MESKEKNNIIFLRLYKNENVAEKLKETCSDHDVKTAVILSGIGQLKNTELGYFKKKGDYSPSLYDGPHELLSLNGNICREKNEYLLHLHAVLGNEKKEAIGGHFIGGLVSITCEIVMIKTSMDVKRILDEKIGLKTMSLN